MQADFQGSRRPGFSTATTGLCKLPTTTAIQRKGLGRSVSRVIHKLIFKSVYSIYQSWFPGILVGLTGLLAFSIGCSSAEISKDHTEKTCGGLTRLTTILTYFFLQDQLFRIIN